MPVRNLILHPDFIHRINDNDTVDSICLYCFGTVASLPKEMDLEQKEYAHASSPKMQHTRLAGEVTSSPTSRPLLQAASSHLKTVRELPLK
jgi:hypothetical protein